MLHLLLSLVDRVYFGNHIKVGLTVNAFLVIFDHRVLSAEEGGNFRFSFYFAHGVLSSETFHYGFRVVIPDGTDGSASVVTERALPLEDGSEDRFLTGGVAAVQHLVPNVGVSHVHVP